MIKAQKFACFVSIVLLLTILLSIVLFAMPITSAEEVYDEYVVFNQQCPNGNFVDTSHWSAANSSLSVSDNTLNQNVGHVSDAPGYAFVLSNTDFIFTSGHRYYFSCSVKSPVSTYFVVGSSTQNFDSFNLIANSFTDIDFLFTSTSNGFFQCYVNANKLSGGHLLSYKNFYCIDLTLMFGADNEPNLDICRNLFIADYYPYNTGSVVTLDGFSNYSQGVIDTNSSYSTTLTYSLLSRNAFLYDNLGASEIDTIDYTNDNKLALLGVVGIPLNSLIRAGNTINISCGPSEFMVGGVGSNVNIAYLYNNTLVPCAVLFSGNGEDYDHNLTVASCNVNFSLPYDIDTLFIYCSEFGSTVPTINYLAYIADFRISFTSFDNSLLLSNSWNSGFDSGYNSGYNKGYNKGVAVGADKQYSFAGLLDAVVQAPIAALIGSYDSSGKRVGGLLNFEFLGVNLSYFFTGLISVTIVTVIIRFILSRK